MRSKGRERRQWIRGGGASLAVWIAACGGTVDMGPPSDDGFPDDPSQLVAQSLPRPADRLDLLLVVDNSRRMGAHQQLLAEAVPELLARVGNPPCVFADGSVAPSQPSGPSQPCPDAGAGRVATPFTDIHVGVISSSLGGHGADTCIPGINGADPSVDDGGRLLTRASTGANPGAVPTYQGLGFLAWDPAGASTPPGEGDLGAVAGSLQDIVLGAGDVGCGFEATLEAWYRFLVDPDPYESIGIENGTAILLGTDTALLEQRRTFLRPDSALAIVVISDEDDCSIRDGGRFFFAAQSGNGQFRLPKPTSACAVDPNDPCCRSCGDANLPPECDASNCASPMLSPADDAINLRCFDQKRRFGLDFLYPVDRYVDGLTEPEIADRRGSVVRNPLFSDLDPSDGRPVTRGPSQVYLTTIVGVPWQDVARRNQGGEPDLLAGLDGDGRTIGGFKTARQLEEGDTWLEIIGAPESYVAPTDPLMVGSVEPRSGTHPATGAPLVAPNTSGQVGPVPNGAEYTVGGARDDLQYACIYPLATPRDCTEPGAICDCPDDCDLSQGDGPLTDNPLCVGAAESYRCTQYQTRAYPGIRHLQVARDLGSQAVVGSICAAQRSDPSLPSYGYRPSVMALADRLQVDNAGAGCLAEPLPSDECRVFEVDPTGTCASPGRTLAPVDAARVALQSELVGSPTVCEVARLTGSEGEACRAGETVGAGWCLADPSVGCPVASGASGFVRVLGGPSDVPSFVVCAL